MKKNNHIKPLLTIALLLITTTSFPKNIEISSVNKSNPFLTTDSVAEAKWPMLGEALLEEGSGNSVADWEDATNENVDFGKRKHLYSRGAVRTTVSVVLGGQFIAKLPQIAKNLISNIKRSKGRIKIKDVAKKVTEASQKRLNELLEKIKNLPNKGIDFLNDFAEATEETIEAFLKRPSLIDSWKIIVDNPILRKKPENLESISKWLDEGIEPQKLTDGIGKSPSKQNLIDELGTAQSKLHTQVLIKNYDNIPRVKKGRYTPNGSVLSDKADLPNGWANNMDLPSKEIENFTGKIEHLELNHGDIIYRVSSANRVKGSYWTRTKPNKLDDVVGGTAVVPEWNNFQYLSEYTIPNGITVKCWKGKAASQPVGFKPDGTPLPSNYHLPGGDEQLFIKFIGHQDPNFEGIVKLIKIEW